MRLQADAKFKAGLVQMCAGREVERNVAEAAIPEDQHAPQTAASRPPQQSIPRIAELRVDELPDELAGHQPRPRRQAA